MLSCTFSDVYVNTFRIKHHVYSVLNFTIHLLRIYDVSTLFKIPLNLTHDSNRVHISLYRTDRYYL